MIIGSGLRAQGSGFAEALAKAGLRVGLGSDFRLCGLPASVFRQKNELLN